MKLRVSRKQIVLYLVAGVVTAAAVAWVGVLLNDRLSQIHTVADDFLRTTRTTTVVSVKTRTWFFASTNGSPRFGDIKQYTRYVRDLHFQHLDFDGSTIKGQGPEGAWLDHPTTWTVLLAGWPFRSLYGWSCVARTNVTVVASAQMGLINNVPTLPTPKGRPQSVSLPFYPLWPGFIANTLIYAALWWLLFTGLVSARAARRARRGLCTRCAYDLRGVSSGVCPECGQARPT